MKRFLMAAAAALILPATAAFAADHQGWGDDNRNPNAWQDRHPHAVAGHPHWSRGDKLYHQYWDKQYYVDDWHARHLRRPPHGYRWVDVDGDYLLVAITTGIILDVMMNQGMGDMGGHGMGDHDMGDHDMGDHGPHDDGLHH